MTREDAGEAVLRAIADFPLDGEERFIPRELRLALARTWHPAFSPSTLLERCGSVLLEWPRFRRVLATLEGFKEREDFIGEWAREEQTAIDAARAGRPVSLTRGDPRFKILQAGTDDWLLGAEEHLTKQRLTPPAVYEELARIRRSTPQAIARKFSRLRVVTGTRRHREHERRRRAVKDPVLIAARAMFDRGEII